MLDLMIFFDDFMGVACILIGNFVIVYVEVCGLDFILRKAWSMAVSKWYLKLVCMLFCVYCYEWLCE